MVAQALGCSTSASHIRSCSSRTTSTALVSGRCLLQSSRPRVAHSRRCAVAVRAEHVGFPLPKPPKGVTQPPLKPEVPPATFGFVENAEIINSRAAMLGFFGILLVEALAGKGVFELVGINVGNGLGFEF